MESEKRVIRNVNHANLGVTAISSAAALLFFSEEAFRGVSFGAGLMTLNIFVLGIVLEGLLKGERRPAMTTALILMGKVLGFLAVVGLVVWLIPLNILVFGLSMAGIVSVAGVTAGLSSRSRETRGA